jgi:hypothetical protein
MIELGIFLLALAAVGVVCGIVNICYNPDEYEYEDMRPDKPELDMISHEEARRKMREGERHD